MNAQQKQWLEWAATLLVVVGALNWGLVGLGGFLGSSLNVVNLILGGFPQVEWLVYVLVGLSGLWVGWNAYAKISK